MLRPAHTRPKVLSFGEVLWDVFGDREAIGGAPFNVAAHLAQLGIQSQLYSRIGSDRRGSLARHRLLRLGVRDTWLQVDPKRPTGWVDVTLDASGQPTYAIGADAAWDAIDAPTPPMVDRLVAGNFSALVCGTLAQRTKGNQHALAAIREILPAVPVFYDVNLRGAGTPLATVLRTLPGTTLVKMNGEEMAAIAENILGRVPSLGDFYQALRDRYGVRILLCTRGAEGCSVHHEGGAFTSPARPVQVVNAVGAGDAFLAAFLAGWLRGLTLEQAAAHANELGAFVAGQPEAVPVYPQSLSVGLTDLNFPETDRPGSPKV